MLFIDTMQKHLNTHPFAPYLLLERIFFNAKAARLAVALVALLLAGLGRQASAQTTRFVQNFVIINGARYYTNTGSGQSFQGASLGSFNRGTAGVAALLGGESNTENRTTDNFTSVQLLYRVITSCKK